MIEIILKKIKNWREYKKYEEGYDSHTLPFFTFFVPLKFYHFSTFLFHLKIQ